jgi:hypothetical protein
MYVKWLVFIHHLYVKSAFWFTEADSAGYIYWFKADD